LELKVEKKNISSLGDVSKIIICLNKTGEDKTDVRFEDLLDEYEEKYFIISELEVSIPPLK
jgi:hypothetical protein